jgi:hypothetical protein
MHSMLSIDLIDVSHKKKKEGAFSQRSTAETNMMLASATRRLVGRREVGVG